MVRPVQKIAKKVIKDVVKKPVKKPAKKVMTPKPLPPDHGRHIYIYNNLLNNRVLYSLTRALKNNRCIKQLTFVGKKSVPSALRKDLWTPMAVVSFANQIMGTNTYRMLREFRRRHETAYPESVKSLPKKERTRKLMDQKANSVADLAASLALEIERITKIAKEPARRPQRGERVPLKLPIPVEGDVVVRWSNIYDFDYAKDWPAAVVHDYMERDGRHTALPPVRDEKVADPDLREIKEAPKGIIKELMKSRAAAAKSSVVLDGGVN